MTAKSGTKLFLMAICCSASGAICFAQATSAPEKDRAGASPKIAYAGRWNVLNDKGKTIFVISLDESGASRTTNAPVTGTWELVGRDIRITWNGDWKDIIRPERDGYLKLAFKPGTTWSDPPNDILRIVKDTAAGAAAEIEKLLSQLTDSERRYAETVLNTGSPPRLNLDDPNALRTGALGIPKSAATSYTVNQIIDENEMLLHGNRFWIEGYLTKDLVTDGKIALSDVMVVVGTKNYLTVLGANRTVTHLRLLSTANADKALAEIQELRRYRGWTAADGDYLMEAKLVEFKGSEVVLHRREEGNDVRIPMQSLSQADQRWVREELKRRLEAKRAQERGKR